MTTAEPILVTGADRSGTTLIYALLASHPEISMVRRTNMWRWFDQRYGNLSDPSNLERCLHDMLRYERLLVLQPDVEKIRAAFLDGPATYGRLFSIFHEQHAARRGRRRWADKSLHTEYAADRVFAELPGAKMIQLLRDPRDRHASVTRRYEGNPKGIGAVTGRWLLSERQGRRNVERHPGRYLLVCYETLATEPEATLRSICDFLGEPFRHEMLAMQGVPDRDDFSGNSSFESFAPGVISTRSIGRYRTVLAPREVAFIQHCASRAMQRAGYDLAPVELTARERSAFRAVDLPVGWSRLLGWLAADRLRADEGVPERRLRPVATP
jgi:hypothetical protein